MWRSSNSWPRRFLPVVWRSIPGSVMVVTSSTHSGVCSRYGSFWGNWPVDKPYPRTEWVTRE